MLWNVWRTVRKLGFRVAAALGLLHFVIAFTPVLGWWTGGLSSKWGPDDGDILVVLSSDMAASDLLGSSTYWRCFYATLVWRQGHFRRVIVSGRGAAPEMKAFLVSKGLPAEAIIVENDSVSTRENALRVAEILDHEAGRVILLTSDYHSRRALAAFLHVGVHATALPYPDAFKRINSIGQRWDVLQILLEETLKTLYYKLQDWT